MLSNVYDVLFQPPALEKETLYVELEALAERLVRSGRLRIDARDKRNFVRLSHPGYGIDCVFSYRELHDQTLLPITKQTIERELYPRYREQSARYVEQELKNLRIDLKRMLKVPEEEEMKLARLVVQSAHPAVIKLILWEEVQIFLSYGFTIGDVMDVESWQTMGSNSGMQSTAGRRNYAIYISCGGDPFLTGDANKMYTSDGEAAMARLMVIGAQEMGHYADIIRDQAGKPVARHSSNLSASKATPKCHKARQNDIKRTQKVAKALQRCGLERAAQWERSLLFYQKHRPDDFITLRTAWISKWITKLFVRRASSIRLGFVATLPDKDGLATAVQAMIGDMQFNLEPQADAYRHEDAEVENAIACAEALARVPQQVVKWGHDATAAFYPNLYRIYYSDVTPGCIQTYEMISGKKYSFNFTPPPTPWFRPLQFWKRQ